MASCVRSLPPHPGSKARTGRQPLPWLCALPNVHLTPAGVQTAEEARGASHGRCWYSGVSQSPWHLQGRPAPSSHLPKGSGRRPGRRTLRWVAVDAPPTRSLLALPGTVSQVLPGLRHNAEPGNPKLGSPRRPPSRPATTGAGAARSGTARHCQQTEPGGLGGSRLPDGGACRVRARAWGSKPTDRKSVV